MIDWMRFRPKFWLQNYPTDLEWDAILNGLLDKYSPVSVGAYVIKLSGVEVWVANYPYAFGSPYDPKMEVLPKVKTRIRLRAAMDAVEREKFRSEIAKATAPA